MVLSFNQECGGVDTEPTENGTPAVVQNYAQATTDCSMRTKVDYNWINELINIFNNGLTQAGIAILPNDEDALKKIVEVLQNADTTNEDAIALINDSLAVLQPYFVKLTDFFKNVGTNPFGDIYTLMDKDNKPFFKINSNQLPEFGNVQMFTSQDDGIACGFADEMGAILAYWDYDGGFHCDLASESNRELFKFYADYLGILGKGQSNMFSVAIELIGGYALTKSFTHDNGLKTTIVSGGTVSQSADTTAIEAFEGNDTSDSALENICNGVCYYLEKCGALQTNQNIFIQNSAVSGASITEISKDTVSYNSEVNKLNQVKALAGADNKGIEANFILFHNGETDAREGMLKVNFIDFLKKLILDTSDDLVGSKFVLPTFGCQMAGHANYTNANKDDVLMAQYEAMDDLFYYSCATPTYLMSATQDNVGSTTLDEGGVHIDAHGLFHIGLFMGRAIEQYIRFGTLFRPVSPIRAKKYGARVIIVDFYVPNPDDGLEDPADYDGKVPNTADGFYGLEVWDNGSRMTLSSVTLHSKTQIKIITTSDFTTSNIEVAYAYTIDTADYPSLTTSTDGKSYTNYVCGRGRVTDGKKGTRGLIRDKATFIPEIVVLDNDDTPFEGNNYCTAFKITVEV